MVIGDDEFAGGFSAPRNYRGRTARWVYGSESPYGQMTATFSIDGNPGGGQLELTGIDSENGPKTPMEIDVNGTSIFRGGNPLPKDDWKTNVAPWSQADFPIPSGILHAGANTLTIKNLVPVNNFNSPPYIVIHQAVVSY